MFIHLPQVYSDRLWIDQDDANGNVGSLDKYENYQRVRRI